MKILFVITELAPAGAEKVVLMLVRQLRTHSHTIKVVSLEPEPQNTGIVDSLRECGAEVCFLNMTRKNALSGIFRLRAEIRNFKPDIVHAHLIHANILSRLACFGLHLPLINTVHIAERRPNCKWHFRLDRLTFPLVSCETAVSRSAAEFHEDSCRFPRGTLKVIYNGTDPVAMLSDETEKELRAAWDLDSYDHVLGSVGRLNFQKGYDLLLNALPEIEKKVPDRQRWLLVILGEGPDRRRLEEHIRTLNLQRINILLPGFRHDASSCIRLFDVFLMPSRYEGYGLALTEAMACGVPVVCSNTDSLPELCCLYPHFQRTLPWSAPNAAALWSDAVAEALPQPHADPFIVMTWAQMMQEYEKLYFHLLPAAKVKTP